VESDNDSLFLKTRKLWKIYSFAIVDEPLMAALLKYKKFTDREENIVDPNGVGSSTYDGKHLPIIDLDFDHKYLESTEEGHGHLYLNVPISKFRWVILMCALRFAKVIEPGFFLWSLRRGHNQVRLPGVKKTDNEYGEYTHGWFFKKSR